MNNYAQINGMFDEATNPPNRQAFRAIDRAAEEFAKVVLDHLPFNSDRIHSIRKIREAAIWAKDELHRYKPARMVEHEGLSV